MDKLQFKYDFLQRFSKKGKLNDNINPLSIIKFVVGWVDKNDPQQELLNYIREERGVINNIMNYISQNTNPCEGISPCSDELINARNLKDIEPYLFKPLEDYFKIKNE